MSEPGPQEKDLVRALELTSFSSILANSGGSEEKADTAAVLEGLRERSVQWWEQLHEQLAGPFSPWRGEILALLRYDRIVTDQTTLAFARAALESSSLHELAVAMHPDNRLRNAKSSWADSLRLSSFNLVYDNFKQEPTVHNLWLLWSDWAAEGLKVQLASHEASGVDGCNILSLFIGNALYSAELKRASKQIRNIIHAEVNRLRDARTATAKPSSVIHVGKVDNSTHYNFTTVYDHSRNVQISGGNFLVPVSGDPRNRIDAGIKWSFGPREELTDDEAKSIYDVEREQQAARPAFNSILNARLFTQRMQQRMRSVVMLSCVPSLKNKALRKLATLTQADVNDHKGPSAGTAFLISPQLLITCHHVLPHRLVAQWPDLKVVFDFDSPDQAGVQYGRLRPADFFWTHPVLDVTVVAFSLPPGDAETRLPIKLSRGSARQQLKTDGRLAILGHPNAEFKQTSLREGALRMVGDTLTYTNDTFGGNSGSPVFTLHWEAVAVHHSGLLVRPRLGDHIAYNSGTFTSSVVDKLIELYRAMQQADVAAECGQLLLLGQCLLQDYDMLPLDLRQEMQCA